MIETQSGFPVLWPAMGFPGGLVAKNLPANSGDAGLIPGGGNGNPLQTEKFHGQRNLAGYSPWGRKESDMIEHEYCTLLRGWISAPDVEHVLSSSVVSDSLWPHGLCSTPGAYVHGDSPGKNIGVGCHTLLQGIFPTQRLNPGLLQCRGIP